MIMIKENFISMTNKILIDIDEDVLKLLKDEFYFIQENMDKIKNINVDNIEPMARISQPISFLREDVETPSLNKEKLLSNSFKNNGDYVIMKRILK